ncbi:unnamed protein product, partial [Mesorhabditis spiculigera]
MTVAINDAGARFPDPAASLMGAYKTDNGSYVWDDGSPMDYIAWATGEPSDNGSCVAMYSYRAGSFVRVV